MTNVEGTLLAALICNGGLFLACLARTASVDAKLSVVLEQLAVVDARIQALGDFAKEAAKLFAKAGRP